MPELRIYAPGMRHQVARLFERCMGELGWAYQPEGRHRDIVNIEDVYMQSGCFWCLFAGDNMVGMVAIREIESDPKTAELKRLYVPKDQQGKGYGRLLFDAALDYARRAGFARMRLDTRRDRGPALHLYERAGFRQIPRYNQNANAELFMELDL